MAVKIKKIWTTNTEVSMYMETQQNMRENYLWEIICKFGRADVRVAADAASFATL